MRVQPASSEIDRLANIMIKRRRGCLHSRDDCEVRCVERCRFSKGARMDRAERKRIRKSISIPPVKLTVFEIERANNHGHRRAEYYGCEHTATLADLIELYSGVVQCFYCDAPESKTAILLDHFIPLSKKGGHVKSNLVPACTYCNLRKRNKMPEVFLKEIGRLHKIVLTSSPQ